MESANITLNLIWRGGHEGTKLYSSKKDALETRRIPEAGFGYDNLRHVYILEILRKISYCVCRLSKGPGTGFLVTNDLLVTNHHVLRDVNDAKKCTARFNYQLNINGEEDATETYKLIPEKYFQTYPEDDLTIVAVDGSPGKKWGSISVDQTEVLLGQSAIVIQHPEGDYKMLSLGDIEIKHVDSNRIQYLSDTKTGSSGSPVLNDNCQIVGIHRCGLLTPDHTGYFRNEAIHINCLYEKLKSG